MMVIIGLTGGIGSGKSTVAKLFEEKGVPILDADVMARALTLPGQPALATISNHFGNQILHPDGTLNRTALRDIIFSQSAERIWLEQLLHPLIREKIQSELAALNPSTPYCIVVIPLLLENNSYPFINRILVVDSPEHLQLERVIARDKTPLSSAKAILATQVTREKRLECADDIIINDGPPQNLIKQVDNLHTQYRKFSENS